MVTFSNHFPGTMKKKLLHQNRLMLYFETLNFSSLFYFKGRRGENKRNRENMYPLPKFLQQAALEEPNARSQEFSVPPTRAAQNQVVKPLLAASWGIPVRWTGLQPHTWTRDADGQISKYSPRFLSPNSHSYMSLSRELSEGPTPHPRKTGRRKLLS